MSKEVKLVFLFRARHFIMAFLCWAHKEEPAELLASSAYAEKLTKSEGRNYATL